MAARPPAWPPGVGPVRTSGRCPGRRTHLPCRPRPMRPGSEQPRQHARHGHVRIEHRPVRAVAGADGLHRGRRGLRRRLGALRHARWSSQGAPVDPVDDDPAARPAVTRSCRERPGFASDATLLPAGIDLGIRLVRLGFPSTLRETVPAGRGPTAWRGADRSPSFPPLGRRSAPHRTRSDLPGSPVRLRTRRPCAPCIVPRQHVDLSSRVSGCGALRPPRRANMGGGHRHSVRRRAGPAAGVCPHRTLGRVSRARAGGSGLSPAKGPSGSSSGETGRAGRG